MTLVFATNNKNKLKEVQDLVNGGVNILSLNDIHCYDDIEETGLTLEANAKIKSDFVYAHFGYQCFADDTGLEVEALNGEPGVFSARYAGKEADSEANIDRLLLKMRGKRNRKARFRTVISLFMEGKQYFFEGVCSGSITHERFGKAGFGYDPVFIPDHHDLTFAEMDMKSKGLISHRGIAIKKLIVFLKNYSQNNAV